MKICFDKKYAFTLAELGIVFLIISIVVIATIKISGSKKDYEKEAMYYSTYTNLKAAVAEMLSQGCNSSNTTTCPTQKALPNVAHTATNANGTNSDGSVGDGFCDRLANNFNTIGTVDCTIKTLNGGTFNKAAANFITTNSLRFFNFGSDPLKGSSCIALSGSLCVDRADTGIYQWADADSACTAKSKRLPTTDELTTMYTNKTTLALQNDYYWSNNNTEDLNASTGVIETTQATSYIRARCVSNSEDTSSTDPYSTYYDVFVDINGPKGNATQTGNKADIMEFWIGRDGVVVPAPGQGGAVDRTYLTASVRYINSSTGKYVPLLDGVTFKEAICKAGKIDTSISTYSSYCGCPHDSLEGTCTTSYAQDTTHCPVNNNTCDVVINKPRF